MAFEGDGEGVPPHRSIPHYHGDSVRIIFVVSAIILIVAQSTGANLPLSTTGAVLSAMMLVIAAGITNYALYWIHWINAVLAIMGILLFGTTAVDYYRAGLSISNSSFIYIEALSLLSLLALYFTIRTIRGLHLRTHLS